MSASSVFCDFKKKEKKPSLIVTISAQEQLELKQEFFYGSQTVVQVSLVVSVVPSVVVGTTIPMQIQS